MPYVSLTPLDLLVAAVLLTVPAVLDLALRLHLTRSLAIAALRTTVQLTAVGFVLRQVFALDHWSTVLPVLLVMTVAATRAALGRSRFRTTGAHLGTFAALVLSTAFVTFAATELVIGVDRWYAPQYVIPLAGMLLGNGLTGVSLAIDRLLGALQDDREAIETRLALGMPLWTATLPWLREAMRTGMVPILNAMSVVGLVSLPGMMTGQILAGADPLDAVAYQILIMFMIGTSTALGTTGICLFLWWRLADPMHRIRSEQITDTST